MAREKIRRARRRKWDPRQEMGAETKETDARTEDRTLGPP